VLQTGCAVAAGLALPTALSAASPKLNEINLRADLGRVGLVGAPHPKTDVWCYNNSVPGPEIRVRQGDRIRVRVENALAEETTIHWHGIRTPNAMDGVPYLTQRPIAPRETFTYEFDAVDAGTFWYHPHQRSFEQVGRGLYAPLIIEEHEPIRVDREVTWVLDDWRLTQTAAISDDFGNGHDVSHNGRVGNTVTINGWVPESVAVRAGERIRLRLINAANARIFGLDFAEHEPVIVALDGQPVSPHAPVDGIVVIGPAMRIDLVIDMIAAPGSRATVVDGFYKGLEYRLVDLAYDNEPLRARVPDWPMELPANPLAEPDLGTATRHEVIFNGGMMGQMMMGPNLGSMMDQMHSGKVWFINGHAATGHMMEPMLILAQGHSYVLAMANETAWHHPIHLHGHSFRVISRNGEPTRHWEWQDTVLMAPRERVEIAFLADNPGDWMFHCHILEHQAAGMMGVIRIGPEETKT
jgi:FtsP/CotA-like multicopper oxidase with cupredoxin domain